MISESFLGIAMLIQPQSTINWVQTNKQFIEESMRRCNINHIKIISQNDDNNNKTDFPKSVETFETYLGKLTDTQLKESYLLLFSSITELRSELTAELNQKIQCFIENFIILTNIPRDIFLSNISVVLFTYTGTSSRKLIDEINVVLQRPEERREPDCSKEIAQIQTLNERIIKITDKYQQLNNDKTSMQRLLEQQLNDCNKSKIKLDKEYDNVLIKLDSLKEQLRQFNNKDPQQIQLNINNLQRELERIQREAEEAETARQREEKEQRRQQEEQKRQQEEQIRQEQKKRRRTEESATPSKMKGCRSFGINPEPCINKSHYKKQSLIFHSDQNPSCVNEAENKFKTLVSLPGCFEKETKEEQEMTNLNNFREDYERTNPVQSWDSLSIPAKKRWVNKFVGQQLFTNGGSRKTIKKIFLHKKSKKINKKSKKINKKSRKLRYKK